MYCLYKQNNNIVPCSVQLRKENISLKILYTMGIIIHVTDALMKTIKYETFA